MINCFPKPASNLLEHKTSCAFWMEGCEGALHLKVLKPMLLKLGQRGSSYTNAITRTIISHVKASDILLKQMRLFFINLSDTYVNVRSLNQCSFFSRFQHTSTWPRTEHFIEDPLKLLSSFHYPLFWRHLLLVLSKLSMTTGGVPLKQIIWSPPLPIPYTINLPQGEVSQIRQQRQAI